MIVVLVIWVGCAILCATYAKDKGRSPIAWAVIGLFFGLGGVALIALAKPLGGKQ